MAPSFSSVDKSQPDVDIFSFYAIKWRIRIEVQFGLMTSKWGILQRALTTQLTSDKWLVLAIARMHKLIINGRLRPGQMGSQMLV